jgi:hypothetical protein
MPSWPLRPCEGTGPSAFPLVRPSVVGATGFEPVTPSVSGIQSAAWRPAADGRVCSVSWAVVCPVVTAVVRCDPVIRGPDVARMWPRWSRAWKARPGSPFRPDGWQMAQLSPSPDRPLLSVGDHQGPVLRARGGHGRRGRRWLWPGSNGHQLDRRVRPVLGDHCLVGKGRRPAAAPLGKGFESGARSR